MCGGYKRNKGWDSTGGQGEKREKAKDTRPLEMSKEGVHKILGCGEGRNGRWSGVFGDKSAQ